MRFEVLKCVFDAFRRTNKCFWGMRLDFLQCTFGIGILHFNFMRLTLWEHSVWGPHQQVSPTSVHISTRQPSHLVPPLPAPLIPAALPLPLPFHSLSESIQSEGHIHQSLPLLFIVQHLHHTQYEAGNKAKVDWGHVVQNFCKSKQNSQWKKKELWSPVYSFYLFISSIFYLLYINLFFGAQRNQDIDIDWLWMT